MSLVKFAAAAVVSEEDPVINARRQQWLMQCLKNASQLIAFLSKRYSLIYDR